MRKLKDLAFGAEAGRNRQKNRQRQKPRENYLPLFPMIKSNWLALKLAHAHNRETLPLKNGRKILRLIIPILAVIIWCRYSSVPSYIFPLHTKCLPLLVLRIRRS